MGRWRACRPISLPSFPAVAQQQSKILERRDNPGGAIGALRWREFLDHNAHLPQRTGFVNDQTELPAFELFSGEPQHETFPRLGEIFPNSQLTPSNRPQDLANGVQVELPSEYEFEGERCDTEQFFRETDTAALLVLKDGLVRFERYALTGGPDVCWISWSVAKSFVSALIGIAIEEGHIESIEDSIGHYATDLQDSTYGDVRIKDVLQMSSGARWNEDYTDPESDISRFADAITTGGSMLEFVAGMQRESQPGTVCQYNSADTQALGFMLMAATGRSITDYMQEKLYEPLGMTHSGHWILDSQGAEMAFGGLNLTARDFAKLGELYRLQGEWQGDEIVPPDWVLTSVTPDAPHLAPGKVLVGGQVLPLGYAYQWWIPEGDRGEFSAIGIYNQFVYVDPSRDTTIVKLSANRAYGTTKEESENREMETVEFLRAIAANLD